MLLLFLLLTITNITIIHVIENDKRLIITIIIIIIFINKEMTLHVDVHDGCHKQFTCIASKTPVYKKLNILMDSSHFQGFSFNNNFIFHFNKKRFLSLT